MTRDEVIKGLEKFIADFKPFAGNHADWERVYAAIALLKQEPKLGKWRKVSGGMSPGGTPLYECGFCGGSEHLHGAEYQRRKVLCDRCGAVLTYPWEKTVEEEAE